MDLPIIPAYRFGDLYDSLDPLTIADPRTGAPVARVGLVNAGLIRRDMRRVQDAFASLQERSTSDMLDICARAARIFLDDELPVSDRVSHAPDAYASALSSTCGLPQSLVRSNMHKIAGVLQQMPDVLDGLTRGLDHRVLDHGVGDEDGRQIGYCPQTTHLSAILPSNSPGVNGLWLPAVALRIPVIIKPGRADPWTPWRIMQAFIKAGCPANAFAFYPTDHEGSAALVDVSERLILFGDASTVAQHAANPRVSVHGPGFSKILFGNDAVDDWEAHLDLMADSVARNGGRSCVNASTIVVPAHARELAHALAEKLAGVTPRALDDPEAALAAFPDCAVAQALDSRIESDMRKPGADDVSAAVRGVQRSVTVDGLAYLLPTVVLCTDADHSLAQTEMLFPFVSVVEVARDDILDWIGPTLVASVISNDSGFQRRLLASREIDRLNLGPVPTPAVRWDQPHEGNLFEFLYRRRAIHVMGRGGG